MKSILLMVLVLLLCGTELSSQVKVKGYIRKDGTYVQPHMRSNPDGDKSNNWSTKGNINPYTGKEGTKNNDNYSLYINESPAESVEETAICKTKSGYFTNSGYEYACQSDISFLYVNSRIRKIDECYYVWVKEKVVNNVLNEGERLAKIYETNEFRSYRYSVYLYVVDLQGYRTKCLNMVYYGIDDKVIRSLSWDFYEINWMYVIPGSIMDGICKKVENMIIQD